MACKVHRIFFFLKQWYIALLRFREKSSNNGDFIFAKHACCLLICSNSLCVSFRWKFFHGSLSSPVDILCWDRIPSIPTSRYHSWAGVHVFPEIHSRSFVCIPYKCCKSVFLFNRCITSPKRNVLIWWPDQIIRGNKELRHDVCSSRHIAERTTKDFKTGMHMICSKTDKSYRNPACMTYSRT